MEKDLLKAIIEELGAAAIEAAGGKKFASLAVKFAVSIMTRDIVLDRLIGLFGSDLKAFAANAAAKGILAGTAPEVSIEELEAKFVAEIAA